MKRLAHVEQHLRDRSLRDRSSNHGMLGSELIPLLRLYLTSMTIQEIADELGPGWTHRLVEYRWQVIRDELLLRPNRQHLERVELIRIVTGLDPCPCECEFEQAS